MHFRKDDLQMILLLDKAYLCINYIIPYFIAWNNIMSILISSGFV